MSEETLPVSAWDAAIPQHLLDMPYDEEYAFTQLKHYMTAAFDNLSHAGGVLCWIRHHAKDEFINRCEVFGYDRNSIGLAIAVVNKEKGITAQKAPSDSESSRINISTPDLKQLSLLLGPVPAHQDVMSHRELSRHMRRVRKENDRLESELVGERTRRNQAEQNLADRIDAEQNWTPDNVDEQHLKDLMEKCLNRAVTIRNILSGLRLKDVTPIQLGFIADYLENMESQVRAGVARVKLQFGLLDPDTVAFYENDADSQTIIDPPDIEADKSDIPAVAKKKLGFTHTEPPADIAEETDAEPPEDKPDGSGPAIINNFNPR